MLQHITLEQTLPLVFQGTGGEPPVAESQVWLRNLTLSRENSYLVTAESGTGKSSLCSFIYGIRTDYSGRILFDGEDIRNLGTGQWCRLRRESLAWLPQEMRLFPELTVMENIMIKNRLSDRYSEQEIRRMLQRLEIDNKADTRAEFLSVGQQQRVAVIRALAQPFDFIILDEPVSHLDARNNTAVAALVEETASAQGAAIIVTSVGNHLSLHDPETIRL